MIFDEALRLQNHVNSITHYFLCVQQIPAELSQFETDLKKLTEETKSLKHLYVQKEEELRDLRAELAKACKERVELDEQVTKLLQKYCLGPVTVANTSMSQLQQKLERIELLRRGVDQIKADCDR